MGINCGTEYGALGKEAMNEEFKYPNCNEAGLVRSYDMARGMYISAEAVEIALKRWSDGFEYLVSMLPEDCTAGFVTHARAIISGDKDAIERTK